MESYDTTIYYNFINSNGIHNTYTLPTFIKRFSRQAEWGRYIHELRHFKTFYKETKRDLRLELTLQFLVTFFEWVDAIWYSRWSYLINITQSQGRGKMYTSTTHSLTRTPILQEYHC